MAGEVTVYRAVGFGGGRNAGTLHIKEGCQYIKKAGKHNDPPLSAFTRDYNKCSVCWPEVPDAIREVHRDEEIENMRHFDGWAIGSIALMESGIVAGYVEDCWIELFNGEGRGREFGGVKAFAELEADDPKAEAIPGIEGTEGYFETYAFATKEALELSRQTEGWYVDEWEIPEEPDYGEPAP